MLLVRKPWDSQPQEAVGHSHAYGKADLSFERGGLKSSVSGATLTLGSTPSQDPTFYGIARVFSSSAQSLNSADWPVLPDGTEYTYLVVFHRISASGAIEFLVNGDNASRSFQYRLESSGAVTLIAFNTAVSTFSVTGSVVPVGEMHCALAVVRQSGVQLFQNGRHTGTSSAITGTIKGQSASEIQIGNRLGDYLRGSIGQVVRWPFALDSGSARELSANPWQLFAPRSIWVPVSASGASATLTGTATTATEADIVAGGKTIVLTLTGDTFVAAGATFDAQRANIIAGLDSAQSELLGWDNVVKALQGVSGVVRTSDTVCTITLDAQATYSITANETITATIPASALSGGVAVVAAPTFQVTDGGGVVTHATSGALTGQGSAIVGTAARTRAHATTGALAGPGSAAVGTAAHIAKHATSGSLTGQGSAIAGTAARVATHDTSGALVGQGAVVDGLASRPSNGVGGGSQRKKVLKDIKRLNELILRAEAPIITIQPYDETDDEEALMLLF